MNYQNLPKRTLLPLAGSKEGILPGERGTVQVQNGPPSICLTRGALDKRVSPFPLLITKILIGDRELRPYVDYVTIQERFYFEDNVVLGGGEVFKVEVENHGLLRVPALGFVMYKTSSAEPGPEPDDYEEAD